MATFRNTQVPDSADVVQAAVAALRTVYGIDIQPSLADSATPWPQRRAALLARFRPAVAARMGVSVAELDAADASPSAVPNAFISVADANEIAGAHGDDIKKSVTYYANLLAQIAKAKDATSEALIMSTGGLLALGGVMVTGVVKGMRTGLTFLEAAAEFLAKTTARAAIALIVVTLLIDLTFFLANLTRQAVGIIVNQIGQPLSVAGWSSGGADMYVPHGKVLDFPYALKQQQNLLAAVAADGDSPAMAAMGFIQGQKNTGAFGIEALMVLRSPDLPLGFAVSFCNPYGADSGVNAQLVKGPISDMSSFYDDMYKARSLYATQSQTVGGTTWTVATAMNSASGDQAYFTVLISAAA